MNRHGPLWKRCAVVIGLALLSLLALLGLTGFSQVEAHTARATTSPAGASFLYQFDTAAQSFLTIPLANGALPIGVAVTGTNPAQVWIAEYGLNRLTHIVFTGALEYAPVNYPVTSTADSGPFLIALDGHNVWFTEREANRVGRLDAVTGQLDEFYGHGLPATAGLADIAVAPDGSIWIAGQFAKRLYRLVITSTTPGDYVFLEYVTGTSADRAVGPYGLDIMPGLSSLSYQIAFASPQGNRIGLLTPSSPPQVLIAAAIPAGFAPTDIIVNTGAASNYQLWFSEPGADRIGLSTKGTLQLAPTHLGPIMRPTFLSRMVNNTLWLSQQEPAGQLARFVYSGPGVYNFTSYPLPTAGLQPNGVALGDEGQVWTVAYQPERFYLPLMLNNSAP